MKVITDLYAGFKEETALALGTFDGVHKGHSAVIKNVTESNYISGAVCFLAPPSGALQGKAIPLLATQSVKEYMLESHGIQLLVSMDFSETRNLSPEEFVEILVTHYNAKRLCCGYNFRFGKNGAGDAALLCKLGKEYGIEVVVVDEVRQDGKPISSTAIRKLIEDGNIKAANRMLGHSFVFSGEVAHGAARGRTLGSPTINQIWNTDVVLPKFGVYAATVEIDGKCCKAVTNIGLHPTYEVSKPLAESYILDYSGDLYGKNLKVSLHDFIRPEKKFDGAESLREQISKDIEFVKNLKI